jgi:hypothetical protein
LPPETTEQEPALVDKYAKDIVEAASNHDLALSDKHHELLDAVKEKKSGVREEKKIREYAESLVAVQEFTAEQKLVIATWYHQLNKLPKSADTKALLRRSAIAVGVESNGNAYTLQRRLIKVPGLY